MYETQPIQAAISELNDTGLLYAYGIAAMVSSDGKGGINSPNQLRVQGEAKATMERCKALALACKAQLQF